jgi:hypothetical protein
MVKNGNKDDVSPVKNNDNNDAATGTTMTAFDFCVTKSKEVQ